eukprot:g33175.t1
MASTSKCLQSSCSQVSLWDLQDQRPAWTWKASTQTVLSVQCFEGCCLSQGKDGRVKLWDMQSQELQWEALFSPRAFQLQAATQPDWTDDEVGFAGFYLMSRAKGSARPLLLLLVAACLRFASVGFAGAGAGTPERSVTSLAASAGDVEVTRKQALLVLSVKSFAPTDASPPTLTASLPKGTVAKPMLFCNLHGLWEGEKFTV